MPDSLLRKPHLNLLDMDFYLDMHKIGRFHKYHSLKHSFFFIRDPQMINSDNEVMFSFAFVWNQLKNVKTYRKSPISQWHLG